METKRCRSCGAQIYADETECPYCGMKEFDSDEKKTAAPPEIVFDSNVQDAPAQSSAPAAPEMPVHENLANGIVGAFLFSLGGVALYFILYQLNYIAGLVGFVTFSLANLGYGVFTGTKGRPSMKGAVVSIIVTVIMLAAAEFICLGYLVYKELGKEWGLTFFESLKITPDVISYSEMWGDVALELGLCYLLAGIASIGAIVGAVKARKKAKAE